MKDIRKKVIVTGLKLHIVNFNDEYGFEKDEIMHKRVFDVNRSLKEIKSENIKLDPTALSDIQREVIPFETIKIQDENGFFKEIKIGLTEDVQEFLGLPLNFIQQQREEIESLYLEKDILSKSINGYKHETVTLRDNNYRLEEELSYIKNMSWIDRLKFLFKGKKFID